MPESVTEAFKVADIIRSLVVGVIGGGSAMIAFISRFQTKKGCKVSHKQHDKVMFLKEQLFEQKIDTIHDTMLEQKKLLEKIADKIWE